MSDSKDDAAKAPDEGAKKEAKPAAKKSRSPRKKKPAPKGWEAYTESNSVPAWVTSGKVDKVITS